MSQTRINPELHTMKELVYSETDGKWYRKMDEIRSEAGAFLSGTTSGDFSSQLTKTDLLTGKGTLASAGFRFLLREILVYSTSAAIVNLVDSTTKKLRVRFETAGVQHVTDLKGVMFSTDCRYVVSAGNVSVHVGGIRYVLLV